MRTNGRKDADHGIHLSEHEKYFELCALSTTEDLTEGEIELLHSHIAVCEECSALFACYQGRTTERMMAELADTIQPIQEEDAAGSVWRHESSKAQLFATLKERTATKSSFVRPTAVSVVAEAGSARGRRLLWRLGAAAAVLFLFVLAGYEFGYKQGVSSTVSKDASADVRKQYAELVSERVTLNAQIAADSKALNDLTIRAGQQEKNLAEVRNQKTALDEEAKQLTLQNQEQSGGFASLLAERDQLSRKLEGAEKSFTAVQDELNGLRTERQKDLLRTTSLEAEIDQLSRDKQEQDETIRQQEQFLVADRDIREMMGARQLYIADVFDVDREGQTRQPFGRVFYTKGKSLVFYAFDLDRRSGDHNAKAFQAWGREGQDGSQPIDLGVFYLDNEANRRWVLKSDDPKVLAQIDAVFVTVEPKGGSRKPSGKPFLYAYLHSAPVNHP